jgi:tagatose 1,6-diphosphate aldolase
MKDLSKLQTSNGYIEIAAFDHRDSLTKYIPEEKISEFKTLCVEVFADSSTAILVDPEYGKDAIDLSNKLKVAGIFSRELSGYTDTPQGRNTELYQEYTSEKLKDMGAEAIKLLIYYNHQAANAEYQRNVVKKVKEETDKINLPLLVEIITYPNQNETLSKWDLTIQAIKDLKEYTDIFKLEYPFDPQNRDFENDIAKLKQITDLCEKPWVLLSRGGMDFENFRKAVNACTKAGAAGYAVGRAIWQEIKDLSTWEEKTLFMKTTARQRMAELSAML